MKYYSLSGHGADKRYYADIDDVVNSLWYHIDSENIRIFDALTSQLVDKQPFIDRYWQRRTKWVNECISRRWGKYEFRKGPVKGTGKKRARLKNFIRGPRTKQELTYKEFARNKRKSLPTSWDDIWRDSQRSWKEQRKTQYK